MKRTITMALALLLVLTACGKKPTTAMEPTTEPTTVPATEAATAPTTEPPTEATTEPTTIPTTEVTEPEPVGVFGKVSSTNALNVREKANAYSAALGQLVAGTQVEIFEQVSVSGVQWGRIIYNDQDAWICMSYVTLDGAETVAKNHVHDYDKVENVAATCTSGGYTQYTCSECEKYYRADYTNAKGHDFGAWMTTKAATATETGTQQRTCNRCSAVETKSIPATGSSATPTPTTPAATEPTPTQPAADPEPTPSTPVQEDPMPTPTACNHIWIEDYHAAVSHQVYYTTCACGARFNSFEEFQAHTYNYTGEDLILNHGGYGTTYDTIIDTPAYSTWHCDKCGETRTSQP